MLAPVMSSQLAVDAGVKILCYGEAGVGKTVLLATLPRPVLISAESGTLSLDVNNLDRVWQPTGQPYARDVITFVISTLQDLEDAYNWCIHPDMQQHFDSIAVDSISEVAEKILAHFKPLNKDPRKAYGEMQDEVLLLIKKFRDIPGKHVYMSAKMGSDKDEQTGAKYFGPSMPGQKLGPQLPYLFDELFRYTTVPDGQGGKTRVLQTAPDPSYTAKDRSGRLAELEYPHLGYIINKIKGIQ